MTKTKRILSLILTVVMMMCIIPMASFAEELPSNGWYNWGDDTFPVWSYFQDGEMVKDKWIKTGKKWYYLDDSGLMAANRGVIDGSKAYFVGKDGAMVTKTGWISVKTTFKDELGPETVTFWYYLKSGGVCTTGWKKIGGKWYYFYPAVEENEYTAGMMVNYSREIINDKVYVFNSDGSLVTKKGWIKLSYEGQSEWYYVKKDGVAATGWKKLAGKWFYFLDFGPMVYDCTMEIDGLNYDFDENGVCTTPEGYEDLVE